MPAEQEPSGDTPAAASTAQEPPLATPSEQVENQTTSTITPPAKDEGPRAWWASFPDRFKRTRSEKALRAEQGGSQAEPGSMPNARDFNPLPPESFGAATTSDEIFAEIGQRLRQRREMLSLTHEEIERHIHVRVAFLAALERGALQNLPSPVQTRGILANYAAFLDLDADAILLRFADGLQARHREKAPQKPARAKPPMTVNTSLPPLRTFIASDLIFGGGMAIMLLLFAIWGIGRVLAVRSESSSHVSSPSISEVLSSGSALPPAAQPVTVIPPDQATPSAVPALAQATDLATLDPNVKVRVKLNASERTYMRVTVDGTVQFEGRADLGSDYTYQGADQIEVLVGNAAALRIVYNDQDLGLMGNFGEVVDRLYTASGIETPTATPRPSPTPSPYITGTPTESPTPTPSRTKTPKPGG